MRNFLVILGISLVIGIVMNTKSEAAIFSDRVKIENLPFASKLYFPSHLNLPRNSWEINRIVLTEDNRSFYNNSEATFLWSYKILFKDGRIIRDVNRVEEGELICQLWVFIPEDTHQGLTQEYSLESNRHSNINRNFALSYVSQDRQSRLVFYCGGWGEQVEILTYEPYGFRFSADSYRFALSRRRRHDQVRMAMFSTWGEEARSNLARARHNARRNLGRFYRSIFTTAPTIEKINDICGNQQFTFFR